SSRSWRTTLRGLTLRRSPLAMVPNSTAIRGRPADDSAAAEDARRAVRSGRQLVGCGRRWHASSGRQRPDAARYGLRRAAGGSRRMTGSAPTLDEAILLLLAEAELASSAHIGERLAMPERSARR